MGEALTTPAEEAVLAALVLVAAPDSDLSVDTRLDEGGIDSLAMVEAVVHLETDLGIALPRDFAKDVTADAGFRPDMAIGEFCRLVARLLPRRP